VAKDDTINGFGGNGSSTFDLKPVEQFCDEVRQVYESDNRPWVVGYSGGKDSTATLQLVWYALKKLPANKRQKPVFVISSDTFVETPVIVDHIDSNLDEINRASKADGICLSKLTKLFRSWTILFG
jgi:DNA sulfur modification protein DndC